MKLDDLAGKRIKGIIEGKWITLVFEDGTRITFKVLPAYGNSAHLTYEIRSVIEEL